MLCLFSNCQLAFRTAEHQIGIPALLDVEDVVSHPSPDRLSILTYMSQFYHKFALSSSDSGVSSLDQSPASSDSETERRGAILSLMDGRRVRSVSCQAKRSRRSEAKRHSSPPIEKENPFKKDFSKNSFDSKKLKQVQTQKEIPDKVTNPPVTSFSIKRS